MKKPDRETLTAGASGRRSTLRHSERSKAAWYKGSRLIRRGPVLSLVSVIIQRLDLFGLPLQSVKRLKELDTPEGRTNSNGEWINASERIL